MNTPPNEFVGPLSLLTLFRQKNLRFLALIAQMSSATFYQTRKSNFIQKIKIKNPFFRLVIGKNILVIIDHSLIIPLKVSIRRN